MEILQMSEKGILGSKAQSMGEAEERVFDNGNRRAGAKSKRSKRPTEAMVVRKEASVSKPRGKAIRLVETSSVRKVAKVAAMKGMAAKVAAEMPPVKAVTAKVAAVPSMATPMPSAVPPSMPPKSLDVPYWRKVNKASCDTDSNKPFHIPLLRYTREGESLEV